MSLSSGQPAVQPMGGGLALPTIFNVTVNSAVLHWLLLMLKDEAVIRDGLGHAVGRILGVLYADYGLLVSLNPEWLHGSLKFLIGLFH